MPGVKALTKIQLGREDPAGTPVAATTIWRGETGLLVDGSEVTFPAEDVAHMMGYDRSYIAKKGAAVSFDETPLTFEQLPIILESALATVTPVQDGSGGYVYTYPFPTVAQQTIKFTTIEGGDNQQAYRCEYSFETDFTLSGKPDESAKMQANWIARQVMPVSFTSSVPLPPVEEALFGKTKLLLDEVTTFPPTTQKLNTFLGVEFKYSTGYKAVPTGEGNGCYFTFVKATKAEGTLSITFEHDATGVAEFAAFQAQTPRAIRIVSEGTAISGGSTYSYKTVILEAVGKYESFTSPEDDDGDNTLTGVLRIKENTTTNSPGQIIVVNNLSALP